ncbi:hypothetical protein [Spirosoma validum]|uniref:Uncharacterized protein n=1 Tax=Spirosoma validum TaxID=2771355 RepID=A0A927B1A0_9BACT|nr:hypothetical protein [Spirosoma validum]MBD2753725.1 hypothetical protein [Spirosoma validum]
MATFELGGTTFNEGDKLIITTPEIGTVTVHTTINGLTRGKEALGLDLGYIKTPLDCRSDIRKDNLNARLSLYSNNQGHVGVMLHYCCNCPWQDHNHALEYHDLTIQGNAIKSNSIGKLYRVPHNHPLAEGYEYLQPKPVSPLSAPASPPPPKAVVVKKEEPKPAPPAKVVFEPTKPAPKPKPAPEGQISLF